MLASNRLGRYHLGERLGQGGMAEVFRAEMEGAAGFTKAVAIKRIRPELATDEQVAAMFLQEAQVARRLEHGGVVQIYDLGVEDGVPYLVIELVDGVSLERILRERSGRIDVADALALIEHVAAALHHAHALTDANGQPTPVVHRDVNPRNILVSRDGVVKLTDFGIAKAWHLPSATLPGMVKGTLGYLSPEQAAGAPVDARTDQFSTGVVLHELLAGRNPLAGSDSLMDYVQLLARGLPRLPDGAGPDSAPGGVVDDALADIVGRAVAVSPADRFPDMEELRSALEAWRVSRGLRTSAEGLRRHVRAILGAAATHQRAPLALGDALAAQLEARAPGHTQARSLATTAAAGPAGHAPARRGLGRVAAIALAGALGIGLASMGGAAIWRGQGAAAPEIDRVDEQPHEHEPRAAIERAGTAHVEVTRAGDTGAGTAHVEVTRAGDTGAGTAHVEVTRAGDTRAGGTQITEPAPAPAALPAVPAAAPPRPAHRGAGTSPRPDAVATAASAPAVATAAPAAAPGRLKINLLPYARVTIDGRPRGQTPVDLAVAAGAHVLVLENPDTGQRREQRVDVAPGQTLVIHQW